MRFLLLILFLTLSPLSNADIFRERNADGGVSFTDIPKRDSAEKVQQAPLNTMESGVVVGGRKTTEEKKKESLEKDIELNLIEPRHNQVIWDNTGRVNILLEVVSGGVLPPNSSVQIYLDQKLVYQGGKRSVVLENIARGTHTLVVKLLSFSPAGEDQYVSDPPQITFHVKRHSAIPAHESLRYPVVD